MYDFKANRLVLMNKGIKLVTTMQSSNYQKYLNNFCKRNKITEAEKKQMRPISARLGRLTKVHKAINNIPKFRPIIDTTSTSKPGNI